MMVIRKLGRLCAVGIALVALTSCDNLLEVQDPSRFTDGDLDGALQAVANGVEGDLHAIMDDLAISAALLSDEWRHTGTWGGWDDTDKGRIIYGNDGSSDGGAALLRSRFAAQDARERFDRLEEAGTTISPLLRAQVEVAEGWADLLLAQHICEAPAGVETAAITDMELYVQARDKLADALGTATGAGATDYALWAEAGVARAELMLGNYGPANTAATNVLNAAPAGWVRSALFQQSFAENAMVNLSTFGFNHAGGLREKWWPLVDDVQRLMNDPLSGSLLTLTEPDSRVSVRHEPGVLGVDGETDYYSQWKYQDQGADIPITHLDEMRLIQAEAAWGMSQFTAARTMLNDLRTAAGLTPIPDAMADDQAEVLTLLLNERFAELFAEGQRMNDLYRFDLVPDMMAAGVFVGTAAQRPTKFPLSSAEGLNNRNIEDDASARCLPLVSSS